MFKDSTSPHDPQAMKFPPWIGPNFGNPNHHEIPPRLLVMGESFYDWDKPEDYPRLASMTINWFLTEEWNGRFWTNIQNSILGGTGYIPGENRAAFWNSVSFCNFVQDMLDKGSRPTEEQWTRGAKAFPLYLDLVRPTHILIFGLEVWHYAPEENYSKCDPEMEQEIRSRFPTRKDRHFGLGQYQYEFGTAQVMACQHPSYPGFSAPQWRPAIQWFLQPK